jgi:predicted RecA/RadA family phage recombinase
LDPPIELYPNSRFGIGVLSYFMLADEITITTCRMSRTTGLAGPVHEVAITGPGHLFEIRKTADQGKPGTTVRLYLRAGVRASCVETLSRLLAIAEFDTTAQHGERQAIWKAGVFEQRDGQEDLAKGTIVASANGNVIWCEERGGLLVDGLWVDHGDSDAIYRGSVVNLTGSLAPRLSVDRTAVLEPVDRRVAELQARAVPDLVAANTLLAGGWLSDLGFENPRLADMIVDNSHGQHCFPADWILLTTSFSGVSSTTRLLASWPSSCQTSRTSALHYRRGRQTCEYCAIRTKIGGRPPHGCEHQGISSTPPLSWPSHLGPWLPG